MDGNRTLRSARFGFREGPKEEKPMFQVIDGTEKYKVVDMVTGGESFHNEKLDAYKMCHVLVNVLHHNYRLEVR